MSERTGKTVRKTVQQSTARNLALEVVLRTMEQGEYCDKALHEILEGNSGLDRRDRAFVSRLAEGTVERCLELDYVIGRYSSVPLKKMKPVVRNILRLSAYQLLYMDQVPDSAACNEGVKLAVQRRVMPLRGFVNGVLRSIARGKDTLAYPARKDNVVRHLSVWYSMPEWIVRRFLDCYGEEETERILGSYLSEHGKTVVRCNLAAASPQAIRQSMESQGVIAEPGRLFGYAFYISGYGRLSELEAFARGWIQVQDESSMLVGHLAEVKQDSVILDVCAAPGGKSLHMADRMLQQAEDPGGRITACDIQKGKVSLIRQNLIRTGIHNVKLKKWDATQYQPEWEQSADIVAADLPCSGLGVIGKKSDIKYKTSPEDIPELAQKQRQILKTVSRYVKPGGQLLYSTCTIAREENEDNVEWILDHLPFEAVSIEEKLPDALKGLTGEQGYLQILPDMVGTDGFFVAAFRRRPD